MLKCFIRSGSKNSIFSKPKAQQTFCSYGTFRCNLMALPKRIVFSEAGRSMLMFVPFPKSKWMMIKSRKICQEFVLIKFTGIDCHQNSQTFHISQNEWASLGKRNAIYFGLPPVPSTPPLNVIPIGDDQFFNLNFVDQKFPLQ